MRTNLAKSITAITSVLSLGVMTTSSAFAINGLNNLCPNSGPFSGVCGDTNSLIGKVVNLIFVVAIIIALAFLIYAGIRYILSQGDKTKVAAARDMIIASLIGLIVVFLSYFLLNLATRLLFGQEASQLVNNVTQNGIFSCKSDADCSNGQTCDPNTAQCK